MIKTFLYCCIISALILLPASFIFKGVWQPYLDQTAPDVKIINSAEKISIGKNGASFMIQVSDQAPGLDEVVVRIRQLRQDHQLIKKKLNGQTSAEIKIEIPAVRPEDQGRSLLSEGSGELEIVAFDRSFYSNRGVAEAKAFVDLKIPHIEAISAQHNLRQGGSQLVFYYASDENLKFSGVKVGGKIFQGFKAAQLDPAFAKKSIYAALYTVPINSKLSPQDLLLVAEDLGGNQVQAGFYNKIAKRTYRNLKSSNARLVDWLNSVDADKQANQDGVVHKEEKQGDVLNLQQNFKGAIDAAQFSRGLQRIEATVLAAYGDRLISDALNLKSADNLQSLGDSFVFTGLSKAKSLQEGEVRAVLKNANGLYTVSVMHALGLSTEYSGLTSVFVDQGQQLKVGQELGNVSDYLRLRTFLSGESVDPTEWWTQDWVSAHILDKIEEAKKTLGIIED